MRRMLVILSIAIGFNLIFAGDVLAVGVSSDAKVIKCEDDCESVLNASLDVCENTKKADLDKCEDESATSLSGCEKKIKGNCRKCGLDATKANSECNKKCNS